MSFKMGKTAIFLKTKKPSFPAKPMKEDKKLFYTQIISCGNKKSTNFYTFYDLCLIA